MKHGVLTILQKHRIH